MIETLKNLFGLGKKINYKELNSEGAIILDVRSAGEYKQGNIKGSINISVDSLANNLGKLKDKDKTIITCCASGMRSNTAVKILKTNGYTQVFNGGGWYSLESKLK